MRKWVKERLRRRKRKPAATTESESTGKVGQARPTGEAEPLQPDYLEAFGAQKSAAPQRPAAPPPPPQKVEVESQPESPSAPPAPAADAIGHAPQKKPKGVVVLAI